MLYRYDVLIKDFHSTRFIMKVSFRGSVAGGFLNCNSKWGSTVAEHVWANKCDVMDDSLLLITALILKGT